MKIIAIGGGEIGRPKSEGGFFPVETTKIDKESIRLTSKKHPKVLFIPTASSDSAGYVEVVKKHFEKRLGCKVSTLLLIKEKLSRNEIEKKVLASDLIYVGGGNTPKMIKRWRVLGVDKMLVKAAKKGIVLSGLSAGAICWFKSGNSDSRKFKNPKADYIKVSGLGWINTLLCPHYDVEKARAPSLKRMMKKTAGVALALDNCAAFEVVDDQARVITSKPTAHGYKILWKKGKFFSQKIKSGEWKPLEYFTTK